MDPAGGIPLDDLIAERGELRITTDNSVWFLRPAEYCRLPLNEQGHRNDYAIDGVELTRFVGHLILGETLEEGGPDGSSSEVPRGVPS